MTGNRYLAIASNDPGDDPKLNPRVFGSGDSPLDDEAPGAAHVSREFVSDQVISDAALTAALGAKVRVKKGPPQTVHREWFDTFDWRLHRAGLTLERVTAAGGASGELLLRRSTGEVLQVVPSPAAANGGGAGTPLVLDSNPAMGPVHARLAQVAEMRALLGLVAVTAHVRTFSVLDAKDKTLARVVAEEPTTDVDKPASAALSRITVLPVRGYEGEARKLARRLSSLPGLRLARETQLESTLAQVGRRPEDYGGQLDVRLTPNLSAVTAVQTILARLLDVAERNMPGIAADLDTEFLHDLRVSVRRARTALKLLGNHLPADQVSSLLLDLKWMSDLTTPTRDLDAHRLFASQQGTSSAQTDDLRPFSAFLQGRRQVAQRNLVRGLRSARWSRARQRWRSLSTTDHPGAELAPGQSRLTIDDVARPEIARAYRKARKLGEAITGTSPAADLHALRKRCKELRYLMEFFASLLERRSYRAVLNQLKSLQDCLGEFQDTFVQQRAVATFADEMLTAGAGSATTLMALGRVVDTLELRQARARQEFEVRFKGFTNKATRTNVVELTSARAELSAKPAPGWL